MSTFTPGRRSVLIGAAATAAFGTSVSAAPPSGPWAIELFTSQGCSSCPPADAQLGKLRERPDIVALSFHVDYWDYIGWKDPFASKTMTNRQHAYARVLHQRYVYTPEMVVDGVTHEPGVTKTSIDEMLAAAQRQSDARNAQAREGHGRPAHDHARAVQARGQRAGRYHARRLRSPPFHARAAR